MTVLVTGAGGQLGLDLLRAFGDHDVVGCTHAELDVADEAAVRDLVDSHRPDLVINAAAWTAVDACEDDPDRAHRVNALGPWWLARACRARGATLVHVSTDYVFAGDRPADDRPLTEFDPVAPRSVYGRSKAAGEQLVRQELAAHHVVRTAWLCGAGGSNFVRTMLRLADERPDPDTPRSLRVVADQFGSPTFTADLARAVRELVDTDRYGTWHRAGEGWCSWYDLAAATFELAGREVDLAPIPTSQYPTPATRPAWSVLSSRHATTSGLTPLPHWRDGLRALLAEMDELAPAPSDGSGTTA